MKKIIEDKIAGIVVLDTKPIHRCSVCKEEIHSIFSTMRFDNDDGFIICNECYGKGLKWACIKAYEDESGFYVKFGNRDEE